MHTAYSLLIKVHSGAVWGTINDSSYTFYGVARKAG
jgi:hypothetical protein